MKKTFLIPLLALILAVSFSCEKEDLDPEYPFTVVVKTYNDSVAVNNIRVDVFTPVNGNTVEMVGFTNEEGKVSFDYGLEAVLLVRATRGKNPFTYIGCADIRLEANKNVVKNVYLQPYDPNVPGCVYSP